MFTGIVGHLGKIRAIKTSVNLLTLSIDLGPLAKHTRLGDSVAINGVCLTVIAKKGNNIAFEMMKETLVTTSLNGIKVGDKVNIELAMQANSRFGGHFVTGHVDEVGTIKKIDKAANWVAMTITISKQGAKYLVPKGSVTLDGISLTIGKVLPNTFQVYLIPYTLKVTNLGAKKVESLLNIETDILAKYIKTGHVKQ